MTVAFGLLGAGGAVAAQAQTGSGAARQSARDAVVRAAARYGSSRGYHVGVAVLDRATGHTYTAGDASGTFASESVVKVFIATRLLVSGQMHGRTARMAWKMITRSDDGMATALYGRVGGDRLIHWMKAHYHVPRLGYPPTHAGWWGNTHITAIGLVRLYGKLAHDRHVAPWLLNAMHHARRYGSDGTYQFFGLPSATEHAAIKQGWGCDYSAGCNEADFNSTGYVNHNRYAVALLARGPLSTYGSPISRMLTGMARALLPGGIFPPPPPRVLRVSHRLASTRGGAVLYIRGRDFVRVRWVQLGSVRVRKVQRLSARRLRIRLPRHGPGRVRVRVATAYGFSAPNPSAVIRFVPPPTITWLGRHLLAAGGGTRLTVRGTDFRNVRAAKIGGQPAQRVTVVSPRKIVLIAPAHTPGPAAMTIRTRFGRAHLAAGAVQFVGPPTITSVQPPDSPASGTTVTIDGQNFLHVRAVHFGRLAGTDLTVTSSTELTVTAPPHSPGQVPLRVISEFGRSDPEPFTYESG